MNTNQFPEFAKLERKAHRAIKDMPEARALDRESAGIERRLARGKISNPTASSLQSLLRLRRKRLVSRWVYSFLCGEAVTASQ